MNGPPLGFGLDSLSFARPHVDPDAMDIDAYPPGFSPQASVDDMDIVEDMWIVNDTNPAEDMDIVEEFFDRRHVAEGNPEAPEAPPSPETPPLRRLFSPTALGAHYALKPKLLMPPPPRKDDAWDFEFDTSDAVRVSHEVAEVPRTQSSGWQAPEYSVPEPRHNHHVCVPTMYAPQIHHHYYLPGHSGPRNYGPPGAGPPEQPPSAPSAEALPARSNLALAEALPQPWSPAAVPAERTPYVLSSYLQLTVNAVLSAYAAHIVIAMVQAVRQDVAHKLHAEAQGVLVEIALCERAYYENHCSPDTIVPALEKMCAHWEKCMAQDPFRAGNRLLVSAHTIGMVVNSLVEPLSLKVLAVFGAVLFGVYSCNFAFGYFRARAYYGWEKKG